METWTLRCAVCNISEIKVHVPDNSNREHVLKTMRKQYPKWLILPTKCLACQEKAPEVKLRWRYKNKKHSFIHENNGTRIVGELFNKKTAGRLLRLSVTKEGETEKKEFDCRTITDGKEMAVERIINICYT